MGLREHLLSQNTYISNVPVHFVVFVNHPSCRSLYTYSLPVAWPNKIDRSDSIRSTTIRDRKSGISLLALIFVQSLYNLDKDLASGSCSSVFPAVIPSLDLCALTPSNHNTSAYIPRAINNLESLKSC
jgi:hypothetical protein